MEKMGLADPQSLRIIEVNFMAMKIVPSSDLKARLKLLCKKKSFTKDLIEGLFLGLSIANLSSDEKEFLEVVEMLKPNIE